jgi:hypothetical protein
MYLIIILTIEINNNNNKNDIVWLILSLFFFSQSRRFADRHVDYGFFSSCRPAHRCDWEKKNNDNVSQTISFLLLSLFISIVKMMIKCIILLWVAFKTT